MGTKDIVPVDPAVAEHIHRLQTALQDAHARLGLLRVRHAREEQATLAEVERLERLLQSAVEIAGTMVLADKEGRYDWDGEGAFVSIEST